MPDPAAATSHRPGSLCPICRSERVHRSRRRGSLERLLRLTGLRVCRCHACNLRFVQAGRSHVLLSDIRGMVRKVVIAAAAVAALAFTLAATVWFSMDHDPAPAHSAMTPPDPGADPRSAPVIPEAAWEPPWPA